MILRDLDNFVVELLGCLLFQDFLLFGNEIHFQFLSEELHRFGQCPNFSYLFHLQYFSNFHFYRNYRNIKIMTQSIVEYFGWSKNGSCGYCKGKRPAGKVNLGKNSKASKLDRFGNYMMTT